MNRLPLLLFVILHTFVCSAFNEELQPNYGLENLGLSLHRLQRIDDLNGTIASETSSIIRKLYPESVVEILKKVDFTEKVDSYRHAGVNNSCAVQFSSYINALSKFEPWALEMLDSSSKIPSGLLIGNMIDLGQYDECVSIDEFKREIGSIRGRHCMYTISVPIPISKGRLRMGLSERLSICMPSSCDAEDVKDLLQNAINQLADDLPLTVEVENVECSDVDPAPYDAGEIITIVIFSLYITFLIGCTVYDIFIRAVAITVTNTTVKQLCGFSLYTSLLKIFNITPPKETVAVVHGLRFFSLCWVILGHEYMMVMQGAIVNMFDIVKWSRSWSGTAMLLASFAVDTFFILSGFLTSYLFMKEMSKGRSFNLILYYVHRYIRLTPVLIALILISIYMVPRWGSGALWQSAIISHSEKCKEGWWIMLLYLHNYVGKTQACLGHTWYLAVDMQLFWISPLILYPLAKNRRIGLAILTGFIIASIITPAVIVAVNKYPAAIGPWMTDGSKLSEMMKNFYIVSHTRAGPWFLGVLLGYVLSKRKNTDVKWITFGWISAILAFAFIFFSYRIFQSKTYEWNEPWEVFYAALSKQIWAFGVCWLIYSSVIGSGGIISKILSLPIYLPFTRISYSIYLVHMLLQIMKTTSARVSVYFTDGGVLYSFFGELIVCIIAGLALSLVFESPFLTLERLIFRTPKKGDERHNGDHQGISNQAYTQHNS